jgi:RNA polymerase sigma-70 factor (sigma-E family)
MGSQMADFDAFAAGRSGALFRTAWLLTGDFQLAEDLVQESLARVFVRWRRVSRMDHPAAYARRVLVTTHISNQRLRRNRERPSDLTPPDRAQLGDDPELRLTLLAGLDGLDGTDRAVLVLRYWEDLDVQTTARLLGMSAANVRTRSLRALQRLRAALGEDVTGWSRT